MSVKSKFLFVQLGSPTEPTKKALKVFLKEFLGDPRVVDANPTFWKIILTLFILPFRPKKSAALYKRIWNSKDKTFPLITNTIDFTHEVNKHLPEHLEADYIFLLSNPRIDDFIDKLEADPNPPYKLFLLPQFPQYAEATIGSGFDIITNAFQKRVNIPTHELVADYHRSKCFIDNSVRKIHETLEEKKPDDLMISFHGIPTRRVLYKNDLYYKHCYETFELLKERINFPKEKIHITFQSRFGSEEWLGPYTDDYAANLAQSGSRDIAVYCPSFVVDCLETLDEIGTELQHEVEEYGANIHAIPCLNAEPQWAKDYAQYLTVLADGTLKDRLNNEYVCNRKEFPVPEMQSPPLSDNAKKTLKIVFLTLFLDLVGFSIIFPMFPAMAKHYLAVDSENIFLRAIFDTIAKIMNASEASGLSPVVLFGGALGALYSFLQFLAAPFWGSLSDKIGRKPVLLVSVFGLALSYLLWFFSGSFTLLILARFIGGIMGGNISTASAVVADVTSAKNRSKGMAFVGIAFACGFLIGPALGGIFSAINLVDYYPMLADYGVNPFSLPAAIAFVLSVINLYMIKKRFVESLPEEKRGKVATTRSANVFKLLKPLPYPGFNLTNIGHFFFLTAFSGMEFTLTFLAVERFGYTSMENAYMFIFIGFILAMVQGGFVRRKAAIIGEKKVALMGMMTLIPGLLIIGYAKSSGALYFGLTFLSIGSAMIIPCLTSLISLYTPAEFQGTSLGVFRSLGALSRVFGPLIAAMIYWKYGSHTPYIAGAVFLILPLILISKLPKPIGQS